jgi:large subunit ribosomal protein L17
MLRNLAQSLFEHGEIRTTIARAREIRPYAERLVTLAVKGTLAARQRATALLTDRSLIPAEKQGDYDRMSDADRERVLQMRSGRRHRKNVTKPGVDFTAESLIARLFDQIGPAMRKRGETKGRGGGYTRMVKTADRRLGDAAPVAIVQLVKPDDPARPRKAYGDKTERRRKSRVKYAFYAGKPLQRRGRRSTKAAAKPAAPAAE